MSLANWNKEQTLKFSIDYTKVDEDVFDFPVLLNLSTGAGQNNYDCSDIFNKLAPPSSGDSSYNFEFGTKESVYLLFLGSSNKFNAIWADEKASLKKGTFYVGRPEDLTIVNNEDGQAYIKNYFSKTTEKPLKSNDLTDINVI